MPHTVVRRVLIRFLTDLVGSLRGSGDFPQLASEPALSAFNCGLQGPKTTACMIRPSTGPAITNAPEKRGGDDRPVIGDVIAA
jgi:hypothetical protein